MIIKTYTNETGPEASDMTMPFHHLIVKFEVIWIMYIRKISNCDRKMSVQMDSFQFSHLLNFDFGFGPGKLS